MNKKLLATMLALGFVTSVQAANVPKGVQLHPVQELTRTNGSEPETLDPANVETVPGANIAIDLFEGLTAIDASGKVVPGVAESWKRVDDTTWTFKIRKDAKFSNGSPITADDFVYAFRRFIDPKQASNYSTAFGVFFANGKEAAEGKAPADKLGVRAIDKNTFEVKTNGPVAFLPELLANPNFAPVHRATIEKFGKDWVKPGNMVSNGAYVLKEWKVNSKLVVEKNPNYWNAKNVQITKVSYLPIESQDAAQKLYQSGEADWTLEITPNSFAKLKAELPKELRNSLGLGLRYYSLNNADPLLKDVRVRKALNLVLDRDLLASKVTADGQPAAYSVMVTGVAGAKAVPYEWAKWPMAKRVEEAKKLMADAGVKPGTKLNFVYNTNEYHKKMAIWAASEWKSKLGLDTQLENLEFKVLVKKRHDGDYQIARNGWSADYNDATSFTTLIECGSDQNDSKNCNPKAQELFKQAAATTDLNKRSELLTEGTRMVMDDYPIIPLLQYTYPRLVKAYVGGYDEKNVTERRRTQDHYIIKH
ncbi:peptide ABC transporter substrate-binding protein [Chitinibacter bivalviorum]|uniref:Peptide ABC transporter substrate-binding protein n=1 Tax=Chitinibacter bivalviorum TaxID=2739434 RepID=A0A7H9BKT7_9NEIS|nr:peptide ABC transporter substrate-binding protein [Chitinibacter bivalviorum]QLG89280.1 peptide ABC transporter substrate-binding protein [Chitinibacter bivalviorum]